jgi:hypothetical protein
MSAVAMRIGGSPISRSAGCKIRQAPLDWVNPVALGSEYYRVHSPIRIWNFKGLYAKKNPAHRPIGASHGNEVVDPSVQQRRKPTRATNRKITGCRC